MDLYSDSGGGGGCRVGNGVVYLHENKQLFIIINSQNVLIVIYIIVHFILTYIVYWVFRSIRAMHNSLLHLHTYYDLLKMVLLFYRSFIT